MDSVKRSQQIDTFLSEAGWKTALREPLAGDASARRYIRLRKSDDTLILMDADPDTNDSIQPFLDIRAHLFRFGFSAPAVFAEDTELGLLLLEDFGDAVFANVMRDTPDQELFLYQRAAETLARLHNTPLPASLAPMTALDLAAMITPAFEFYAPDCRCDLAEAQAAFTAVLTPLSATPPVLCLRDFHAENMIFLPERNGHRQVGLLDFQDAFVTHPAYDLVSMLQDARRDLGQGIEEAVILHFLRLTGRDEAMFRTAYAALGAQRNLRILGIFARLAETRGKPQYLALQPRVWRHLQTNLAQPGLEAVRKALDHLPAPESPK